MSIWKRKQIPENVQAVTHWVYGPSLESIDLARSMAVATNPVSPMASGVHGAGGSSGIGFWGDPGYGLTGNRYTGRTDYPVQGFYSAVRTTAEPINLRIGSGAMTSGSPGLPSTGGTSPTDNSLAWMSLSQITNLGMGA